MDNSTIVIGLYSISIIIAILLFIPKKTQDTTTPPINSYDTLIEILQQTIAREVQHHHTMIYKVRDVKVIYNFQDDLTRIVKDIMSSLSLNFLKELEYYHSRDYVIRHVTRIVEEYLIEYTRQNKIKTK